MAISQGRTSLTNFTDFPRDSDPRGEMSSRCIGRRNQNTPYILKP